MQREKSLITRNAVEGGRKPKKYILFVGRKTDFEINFICRVLFEKHEILLV
jgi:hypothetical protein